MMRIYIFSMFMLGLVVFLFLSAQQGFAPPGNDRGGGKSCSVNMAPVGDICMDVFEVSVWSLPPSGDGTPRGQQFGATSDNYPCSDNGNDCSDTASHPIYAASAPGVTPSAFITWFQAQQACLNVGKRLPTNAEWQGAAAGTPTDYEPGVDDGVDDCHTSAGLGGVAVPTGSRSNCVSNFGLFDMVGNVVEWVADWIQDNMDSDSGSISTALYGNDRISGVDEAFPEDDRFPSALSRGGGFFSGSGAGVFALGSGASPTSLGFALGFRCARNR